MAKKADYEALIVATVAELQNMIRVVEHIEIELSMTASQQEVLLFAEQLENLCSAETATQQPSRGTDLFLYELEKAFAKGLSLDDHSIYRRSPYAARLEELIAQSETDPVAFEAVSIHGAGLLRMTHSLHPLIAIFIADVLLGQRLRPTPIGRRKNVAARAEIICAVIEDLCSSSGLKATRNDETSNRVSACDIVAWSMARLKLQPARYSGVKNIWLGRDRSQRKAD